ncbi:AAA family ATPase [Pseudomonas sp. B1-22]|uniref:AAA family ATPase n=1 Tax=Pseudomonas sp. B1-22 TaxID=3141456 RepID=UPI003D274270
MEKAASGVIANDGFGQWLSERPKWLQTAAAMLAATRKLPDAEKLKELADLCQAEAGGLKAAFEKPPADLFPEAVTQTSFRIRKLDKVIGVNAIQNNACLDFGEGNLVSVFGMNGTGKSGYAKLLKQACGAKNKAEILPNVFTGGAAAPSCEISVTTVEGTKNFPWSESTGAVPSLRTVHVFDSDAADAYVGSNSEASYEPRRMRFLSALLTVADAVAKELAARKAALPKNFPAVPLEHTGTAAAAFATNLKANTTAIALDEAAAWSSGDEEARHTTEAALKQIDPTQREQQLKADQRTLELFKSSFDPIRTALSSEKVAHIISLRGDAMMKRKAASEDAGKVFAESALEGIGNASWRLLWEQARKYSEETAYPDKPFPAVSEGDLCVLCHQPLDDEARERLTTFETFVKGGLEAAASTAERAYNDAVGLLPKHFERKVWDHNMEFLKVSAENSSTAYEMVEALLKALPSAVSLEELPVVDLSGIDAAFSRKTVSLEKESLALADLRKEGKKQELERTLKELKARHWLSVQKEAATAEITRLGSVRAIEKAEALTRTNSITLKKNEIANDELAAGYQERFLAELKALGGGRLKVEPVPVKEGKGKISFKLSIKGATIAADAKAVLSEGESRVVALAAFLADISGSGLPTPFIFDDPVSSLDQEFEERVVERLLALAKTRQVIVFTHRLSLIALLEDAVEAEKRIAAAGATTTSISVLTLRRLGASTGSVDELDVRHKKPKSGFAVLRDQKLPQIRKLADQGNATDYDSAVKSLCGDFRILVERSIERVMLDGLMERFRRSVQTRQIRSLAKIKLEDCALIDEMMTKYSRFEHSQPDELASMLPVPDEIAEDIGKVIAWMDEFSARAI